MSSIALRSGARATTTLLFAYAVATFIALPLRCYLLVEGEVGDATHGGFLIITSCLQLIAMIQFGKWLKFSYGALPFLGFRTRYTPGMAVAVFLIPFANFFRTGDVVDELIAGTDYTKVAPVARVQRVRISILVKSWWYFFLLGAALNDATTALLMRPGLGLRPAQAIQILVVAHLLSAGSALLAARFVDTIQTRLQNCAARLRVTGKDVSPAVSQGTFVSTELPLKALRASLIVFVIVRVLDVALALRFFDVEAPGATGFDRWLQAAVFIMFCLSAPLFLWWVYRLASNLRIVGVSTVSPVWAVVGFLIPIVNIAHALSVMNTFWRASQKRAADDRETSPAVTTWWVASTIALLLAAAMKAMTLAEVERQTLLLTVFVTSGFVVIAAIALYRAVSSINEHAEFLESQLANDREAIKHSALSATIRGDRPLEQEPLRAKKVSWSEVLLPIASAVDEGLGSETDDDRQARAIRDRDAVAARKAAAKFAPRQRTPKVSETTNLTKILRVVMLLSSILAVIALLVFAGNSVALRGTATARLLSLLLLTIFFGLPTWLLLAAWVYRTQRNIEAIDSWTLITPSRTAMFRLRESRTLRAIAGDAFGELTTSHRRRLIAWTWTLRIIQLAPLLLFAASPYSLVAVATALLITISLLMWAIVTANLLIQIDEAVEMKSVAGAAIPQTPRPEAPDERPDDGERREADRCDDGTAMVGQHAGGDRRDAHRQREEAVVGGEDAAADPVG